MGVHPLHRACDATLQLRRGADPLAFADLGLLVVMYSATCPSLAATSAVELALQEMP